MPEEAYWESLFDVPLILDRLGIDGSIRQAFELGCGYGTFAIPVARRIGGTLTAVDIDPAMVERTRERASQAGLPNVTCMVRDVVHDGYGIASDSVDACLLFNILHGENPQYLLGEALRVLRPGGRLFVIHWRHDRTTPRGPSMDIRPKPEQIVRWMRDAGLTVPNDDALSLPPYHYGIAGEAPAAEAPKAE